MEMFRPHIEILNQDTDYTNHSPSFLRILVDRKHIKYITIDPGTYNFKDLCLPSVLQTKLPVLPSEYEEEPWNVARVCLQGHSPTVVEAFQASLPTVHNLLFPNPPTCVDYLSIKTIRKIRPNVSLVSTTAFNEPVIAKFANFYWETEYIAEIQAYSWLNGHDIPIPQFLGYIMEGRRVIGLIVENVTGKRATSSDLRLCRDTVSQLHSLGIKHGALDKNKFLISQGRAVLVGLETAERCEVEEEMEREMDVLLEQFQI